MPATIVRSICRALDALGYASLTEFSLANSRRADVLALGRRGEVAIVEVKSSLADFRADRKWPAYRAYCDRLITLSFARAAAQRLRRFTDPGA